MRLKQRLIHLPDGVDIVTFVEHDGNPPNVPTLPQSPRKAVTIGHLKDRYTSAHSNGTIEANSLYTAKIHFKHVIGFLAYGEALDFWRVTGVIPDQQLSLLDRMVGHWVLKGVVHGLETTHDVDMDWVLNHEYLRIHEVSRERNGEGLPVYEAYVTLGRDHGRRPGRHAETLRAPAPHEEIERALSFW